MDDVYEKLRKDGKNSVDNLVEWLKSSKIIEEAKEAEDDARKLFADVKNKADVELPKFKQVVTTLAEQQQKTFNDLSEVLAREGPKLVAAIQAGINAFKEALK